MHAVGDRGDGHLGVVESRPQRGEHSAGHHAVQLGHAVGALRQPQAHHGHVEHERVAVGVVLAAEVQDLGHRHVRSQPGVEEVLDLRDFEAVDAGRDRGVGGEHGGRASGGQCLVPAQRLGGGHHFLDAFDAQEAGVALVGVEHLRRGAAGELLEGAQRLDAAHAQQEFLLEPVVAAAAVQAVGDAAGGFVVAGNVGVQQQQRNTPDVGAPDVRQQRGGRGGAAARSGRACRCRPRRPRAAGSAAARPGPGPGRFPAARRRGTATA